MFSSSPADCTGIAAAAHFCCNLFLQNRYTLVTGHFFFLSNCRKCHRKFIDRLRKRMHPSTVISSCGLHHSDLSLQKWCREHFSKFRRHLQKIMKQHGQTTHRHALAQSKNQFTSLQCRKQHSGTIHYDGTYSANDTRSPSGAFAVCPHIKADARTCHQKYEQIFYHRPRRHCISHSCKHSYVQ